jgi:hypothetical protein
MRPRISILSQEVDIARSSILSQDALSILSQEVCAEKYSADSALVASAEVRYRDECSDIIFLLQFIKLFYDIPRKLGSQSAVLYFL